MAKKNKQQRVTETQVEPTSDAVEVAQAEVVEEQYHPEDVASLTQMAENYADVEKTQVKVADDRQSAMVLMRHLSGTYTLLMVARNAAGDWLAVRAMLVKEEDAARDFQKPSSIKPA